MEKYTIVFDADLKLTKDCNYRVIDSKGNNQMDSATGRMAFTLETASAFLFRLAVKTVMECYLRGEQNLLK